MEVFRVFPPIHRKTTYLAVELKKTNKPTNQPKNPNKLTNKKKPQEKEKRARALMVFLNLGNLLFPEQSYGLRIALSFNLHSYFFFF